MSHINKEEHKEIANGSTIITVLQSTAAPLGVAVFSSFVQSRSQQYTMLLTTEWLTGELLRLQSTLLAMHEAFLLASLLILVAFGMMCLVPPRRKETGNSLNVLRKQSLLDNLHACALVMSQLASPKKSMMESTNDKCHL